MKPMSQTSEIANEFLSIVDSIYGVYLDATFGFHLCIEHLVKTQNDFIRSQEPQSDVLTISQMDNLLFFYTKGSPNETNSKQLHQRTQGQIKQRNQRGDSNEKFIGNMSLVSIYSYW